MHIPAEELGHTHTINPLMCKKCTHEEQDIKHITDWYHQKQPAELITSVNHLMSRLVELQQALNKEHSRVSELVYMNLETWKAEEWTGEIKYGYHMDENSLMDKVLYHKKVLEDVISFIENFPSMYQDLLPLLSHTYRWLHKGLNCVKIYNRGDDVEVMYCCNLDPFSRYPCPKMSPTHCGAT
jgi:hypothetical protein